MSIPENIKKLQNKIEKLEKEISEWAYWQCSDGNDTPEMRELITDGRVAYWYCKEVKDRPEMWRKITDSDPAYRYCLNVKDRPEVRKYIKQEKREDTEKNYMCINGKKAEIPKDLLELIKEIK